MNDTLPAVYKKFALRLWRGPIPATLIQSLRDALDIMFIESHINSYMSPKGYIDYAWDQMIAAANGQGELWLYCDDTEVRGFLLGSYSKEMDNQPTYIIRQAWVSLVARRQPIVKEMLRKILLNAKSNFCKHVLITSSRNSAAYLRWLGPGWKQVTTILKGDI